MSTAACLIGAGYSHVAGLPLGKDLLSSDVLVTSEWARRHFSAVWEDFHRWESSNPNGFPEQYLTELFVGARGSKAPVFSSAIALIAAVLATPRGPDVGTYNTRYSVRVTQPSRCAPHVQLWSTVFQSFDQIGVLTTNYDLLIERALRHRPMKRVFGPGFFYGGLERPQVFTGLALPFTVQLPMTHVELTGSVPLFKLHGSLSWSLAGGKMELFQDMRPAFRRSPTAAIIPPILHKDTPSWLLPVWTQAEAWLTKADTWIICGYSLPSYDVAINDMLSRSSNGIASSIVILDPVADALAERYAAIAPHSRIITLPGLPNGAMALAEVIPRL